MSTEEQDAILGKLMREVKESDRLLALHRMKLLGMSEVLAKAAVSMLGEPQAISAGGSRVAPTLDLAVLDGFPAKEELLSAMAEYNAESARNASLRAQLKDFE